MDRNRINSERIIGVVGLVFLLIATVTSFLFDGDPDSIIEFIVPTRILIPVVHCFCVLLAVILIIKPGVLLMMIIFFLESELTILTDFQELGIFFFYAILILLLCKDLIGGRTRHVIPALFCVHFVTLLLTYTHGIKYMIISIGYSVFCFAFYLWIYSILKAKLSCLFPKNIRENHTIIRKPVGSEIKLSDYISDERQRTFVYENFHNKLSYREISEKYFVSISTVKKLFAGAFKIFNVSNIEELRLLLLQYQVSE